jgi:hypothetical protein
LILTVPLGRLLVSLSNILSEEVWDVSRVGLGFLVPPKFRVLEKVSASLFHYFGVWILTVALRSSPLVSFVSNIFV